MNVVAEEIRRYIAGHYKEDLSLQDVAGAMRYSDAYFCKIFKKYFNRSFIVYLNELRIEKAKMMLEDAVRNIKDKHTQGPFPPDFVPARVELPQLTGRAEAQVKFRFCFSSP